MRVRTPAAKVGYLLTVVVVITLTAIPLAAISFELGIAWATVAVITAVALSELSDQDPADLSIGLNKSER